LAKKKEEVIQEVTKLPMTVIPITESEPKKLLFNNEEIFWDKINSVIKENVVGGEMEHRKMLMFFKNYK
jgi:hypothetical protein